MTSRRYELSLAEMSDQMTSHNDVIMTSHSDDTPLVDRTDLSDLPHSASSKSLKNFAFERKSPVTVNEFLMRNRRIKAEKTSSIPRLMSSSGKKTSEVHKPKKRVVKRYRGLNLELDPKQYTLRDIWEMKDR